MQRRYKKIISLILLINLGLFNLALPLPVEAGKSPNCAMHHCHCGHAMKHCCCSCRGRSHDRKGNHSVCVKMPRCMDVQDDGIVCNGLSHPTLIAGDICSPPFLSEHSLSHYSDNVQSSLYSKAIEKPPRIS